MGDKPNNSQPAISLPKGGGAIKGIGETFQPNLFSGTGNFSVPIFTSPGRAGFGPQLALQYSTGNGNGPFGLGWQLSIPRITRKTEKGLPKYTDEDVFVMSGAEDLVPKFKTDTTEPDVVTRGEDGNRHTAQRYRPRTEGLFARIEKWVHDDSGDVHWRATTKDNVTSIYGRTRNARISDPDKPDHIFEWLLQETYDAKGNHIFYEYAGEDPDLCIQSIFEQNRHYTSQRYIRRIYYGNAPAQMEEQDLIGPRRMGIDHTNHLNLTPRRYLFEVLFDYGDLGNDDQPEYGLPAADGTLEFAHAEWALRDDAFSAFRSGFEIRTLRRCRRVLMVHHFKELGDSAYIVKSTDFQYCNDDQSCLSLLKSATVTGYRKENGRYKFAAMPPVSFGYSQFQPQKQHYQSLSARHDDLPPFSLKNPETTLVDLFGDGLPDVLNTTQTGYYYWKNLGNGQLDMRHPEHTVPAGLTLSHPAVAFADLGGDGLPDLMVVDEALSGFFEATPDGEWKPFKVIDYPSFGLNDPNVRLLDLTGDGRSDALMTLDHHFLWFECKGEKGYGEPQAVERKRNLDDFPDIYFNDPSGRVRLADMTGDGLNDIVLVHNGRIDYWPNMGYGEFGQRITMKNAPHLEYNFDPGRLFLADLDGSGCTDLVYVGFNEVHFWFNQSGNGWSRKQVIHGTPFVTSLSSVQFADVFGTGTATLVWSYDFNFQPGGNYKALDFCGGVKPYVLTEMDNNMGATTRVQYAPSTKFYLEDKKNGLDWATNLPFPVQVVEKVEVIDHIGKTKLTTTYQYHHGYFDGREREFRGFGRVDQFDTETFDDFTGPGLHDDSDEFINSDRVFHVPPVETRTWFHTGIYFDEDRLIENGRFFDHQELMDRYRLEYSDKDQNAFRLAPHEFEGIGPEAPHEAYRALRGAVLRAEVFGRDDTDKQDFPYVVTENRYLVKQLQPKNGNHHGVYLTTTKESISYQYERNPEDPRIAHQINLEIDPFGNIIESTAIGYPRRTPFALHPEQSDIKATYTWSRFINKDSSNDHYYVGISCESKVYELHGLTWRWPGHTVKPSLITADDLIEVRSSLDEFRPYYPAIPENIVNLEKRIVDWKRIYFRKDDDPDLIDPKGNHAHRLNLGEIASLGLPYETYQAAFNEDLLQVLYDNRLENINQILSQEGGYHEEDQYWWIPSGRQNYIKKNFFQPLLLQDPFGNTTTLAMDSYALLMTETRDAKDNITRARFDYRVLQPCELIDPNNNHTIAAFDVLGMVIGTAIQGKIANGQSESGDSSSDFQTDLTQEQIDNFFNAKDPHIHAAVLLKDATTRIIYDMECFRRSKKDHPQDPKKWVPAYAATLARETHFHDPLPPGGLKIQISFSYSDGLGRETQKKIQAEPEPVEGLGEDVDPRWVGTGWTIFNNKGKPVRQYEPFFSQLPKKRHHFEFGVKAGVSPILFFDPLSRVVCTINPNHTYAKNVFDSWQQTTWDVNDTVLLRPLEDKDVKDYVGDFLASYRHPLDGRPFATWYDELIPDRTNKPDIQVKSTLPEQRAALLTESHGGTATTVHLDSLGRPFLNVGHNGWDENDTPNLFYTYVALDIEGNNIRITDPRQYDLNSTRNKDKQIHDFIHVFDVAGRKLRVDSVDAGLQLVLPDVSGNPLYAWDSVGHTAQTRYDTLRRPAELWVTNPRELEPFLAEKTIYGEERPNADTTNHRGQVWKIYDGAGLLVNDAYDYKGNLIGQSRRLVKPDHIQLILSDSIRNVVEWSQTNGSFSATYAESILESVEDQYSTANTLDALNRVTSSMAPDGTVNEFIYNEANLLNDLHVTTNGHKKVFIENIEYNAKGQRIAISYGNGVKTKYKYDSETFLLSRLTTSRKNGSNPDLQDLYYTYDPTGNITSIRDDAHKVIFNHNDKIEPESHYLYDPLYRLIEATGREHEAMTSCHYTQHARKHTEFIGLTNQPVENAKALCNYVERYEYDKSGNLALFDHWSRTLKKHWRRTQTYASDSNRIYTSGADDIRHQIETGAETSSSPACDNERGEIPHDNNGNIERLSHLPEMKWDFRNQLVKVQLNVGSNSNKAFYQYDSAGQRVRKIVVKNGTIQERIYLGGFEIYTERNGSGHQLRRDTIHVIDDKYRIALIEVEKDVERRTVESTRYRYQLSNHLGSSVMEIDGTPEVRIISYEEYYPYGDSSYIAGKEVNGEIAQEVKDRRFRYSGKERDDETGLYYYGGRYFAPYCGRWVSCDSLQATTSFNCYLFCANNPVIFFDPNGYEEKPTNKSEDETTTKPDNWGRDVNPVTRAFRNFFVLKKADDLEQEAVSGAALDAEKLYEARKLRAKGLEGAGTTLAATGEILLAGIPTPGPRKGFSTVDDSFRVASKTKPSRWRRLTSWLKKKLGTNQRSQSVSSGALVNQIDKELVAAVAHGHQPKIFSTNSDEAIELISLALYNKTRYQIDEFATASLKMTTDITIIGHAVRPKLANYATHFDLGRQFGIVTPEKMAAILVHKSWKGGSLRLGSCLVGNPGPNGEVFAQRLADELHRLGSPTTVIAPRGFITTEIPLVTDPHFLSVHSLPGEGWTYFDYGMTPLKK